VKLYQEGKNELFAYTESKRAILLNVKFGQSYYLKCGLSSGVLQARPELQIVSNEQGLLEFESVENLKNYEIKFDQ